MDYGTGLEFFFRPFGAGVSSACETHGLRRGLRSFAASRLCSGFGFGAEGETPSGQPARRRRYNIRRGYTGSPWRTATPAPDRFTARLRRRRYNSGMYHYDPTTALEELNEDATLPNPVHVRDMILRKKVNADKSLELNRLFVEYQKFFGETQKLGREILKQLAG